MENKLVKHYKTPVSLCDNTVKLSIPSIFSLFMDIASEHALYLGIGMNTLAKDNLIWVASKTKISIKRRPNMLEDITLSTWPQEPRNIRYNRYYTISDKDGVIIEGKSEWTILDLTTGRPRKSSEVYPTDIEHLTDVVCDEPFSRLSTDFSEGELVREYTVCSGDIDSSQHMNNVAYIRAILSSLSCNELADMNIREMEVTYRTQCFEGEKLEFRRKVTDDATEFGVLKSDSKTAAVVRIVCE